MLKIYSMALILVASNLVACSNLPQFPAKIVYEMIPEKNICAKYKVTKEKPLQVEWIEDLEIKDCPVSIFGFSPDDTAKVFDWIRNVQFPRGRK